MSKNFDPFILFSDSWSLNENKYYPVDSSLYNILQSNIIGFPINEEISL